MNEKGVSHFVHKKIKKQTHNIDGENFHISSYLEVNTKNKETINIVILDGEVYEIDLEKNTLKKTNKVKLNTGDGNSLDLVADINGNGYSVNLNGKSESIGTESEKKLLDFSFLDTEDKNIHIKMIEIDNFIEKNSIEDIIPFFDKLKDKDGFILLLYGLVEKKYNDTNLDFFKKTNNKIINSAIKDMMMKSFGNLNNEEKNFLKELLSKNIKDISLYDIYRESFNESIKLKEIKKEKILFLKEFYDKMSEKQKKYYDGGVKRFNINF